MNPPKYFSEIEYAPQMTPYFIEDCPFFYGDRLKITPTKQTQMNPCRA